MNSQDNNLPEFTYEDYLRDMSEYFMLQTYKTGNMPTIVFRQDDDINPTTVPEVNGNTITIKIPREADSNLAYNKIINHCYEGVQLQIGNNNVTTVKIDPQPYTAEDIKEECHRCNFETDKENYHKAIKGPDGNNFKLTVYGYSPEKNTQTVPVNGTPDSNTKEQDKVSNIDLLTGAFLQYMYSGFQNFPEYIYNIDVDEKNDNEIYLYTLLHLIRYRGNEYPTQDDSITFTDINIRNVVNLYKAYLEEGVNTVDSIINISKLLLINKNIEDGTTTCENWAITTAKTLANYNDPIYKKIYKDNLHASNLDEFDTENQLDIEYGNVLFANLFANKETTTVPFEKKTNLNNIVPKEYLFEKNGNEPTGINSLVIKNYNKYSYPSQNKNFNHDQQNILLINKLNAIKDEEIAKKNKEIIQGELKKNNNENDENINYIQSEPPKNIINEANSNMINNTSLSRNYQNNNQQQELNDIDNNNQNSNVINTQKFNNSQKNIEIMLQKKYQAPANDLNNGVSVYQNDGIKTNDTSKDSSFEF